MPLKTLILRELIEWNTHGKREGEVFGETADNSGEACCHFRCNNFL